jgi:PAS domain S-box-containing protein
MTELQKANKALQADIGERQQAQQELRTFLAMIPTMVWLGLPDGSVEFHNQRWLDYTGMTAEQARGWGWTASIHPEDLPGLVGKLRGLLATEDEGDAEGRLRRFDGQYRWFLFRAAPLRDERGVILKWYGATTDIEDRKRAEDALRRSEAYLVEAERLSHTGSWVYDIQSGAPIYWSAERSRISRFDPRNGPPTLAQYRALHSPEEWSKLMEAFARAIRDKTDFQTDATEVLSDGTTKFLCIVGHPVLNPAGEVTGLIGSTMDLTERKQAADALRKAQANLAHMSRLTMIGELTASIAHEVNQPLAAVVTNANACLLWLDRASPNLEEAQEAVRRIIRDGNRGSHVIARIRDLVRKRRPSSTLMDINDVVREIISLTQADLQGVMLQLDLTEHLPRVPADPVQLQQVLLNLVMNAIDAMKPVTLRRRTLRIHTRDCENRTVLVSIKDSGVGLNPNQMEQLFDTFYTTKPEGLGMGLSISRSIIEGHGGRLWAETNNGPGATFQFTLPIADPGAA